MRGVPPSALVLVRTRGATVTGDADPIKAAVERALREQMTAWWQTPPRLDLAADVAVEAHRQALLDQRDDGERWVRVAQAVHMARSRGGAVTIDYETLAALLAALADAEIARRQAEADRDVLIRVRDEAVGKTADYAELSAILAAERDRLAVFATGCAEGDRSRPGQGCRAAGRGTRAPLPGLRARGGAGDPGHPRRAGRASGLTLTGLTLAAHPGNVVGVSGRSARSEETRMTASTEKLVPIADVQAGMTVGRYSHDAHEMVEGRVITVEYDRGYWVEVVTDNDGPGQSTVWFLESEDALTVYPHTRPLVPTDQQVRDLRDEAATAGDAEQVRICDEALDGDGDARAECARVIVEAQSMAAER